MNLSLKDKMKRLILFTLLFPISVCFGQNKIEGKYSNHFGDIISLSDSIRYYHHKVVIGEFSNTYVGVYKRNRDTLFLESRIDFGAMRRNNSSFPNKQAKDSIIGTLKKEETELIEKYEWRFIRSLKMILKQDKLYLINSKGELDLREFMKGGKKYGNYFTKTE